MEVFTVKTITAWRVVVVVVVGVVVVEVVWDGEVVGLVAGVSLHSGDTGLPGSLLQLMYKLVLSEVVMALMALIESWLLMIFTFLVISTIMEFWERSRKMLLVIENISELDTEILFSGNLIKVEEFTENVRTLSALILIGSSICTPMIEKLSMFFKLISRC